MTNNPEEAAAAALTSLDAGTIQADLVQAIDNAIAMPLTPNLEAQLADCPADLREFMIGAFATYAAGFIRGYTTHTEPDPPT